MLTVLTNQGYVVEHLIYNTHDEVNKLIDAYKTDLESYFDRDKKKVTIIAHSFGTSLTDFLIAKHKEDVKDYIERVITVGGVHRGSPWANLFADLLVKVADKTIFFDCNVTVKNTMEVGDSITKYVKDNCTYDTIPLIALSGLWEKHSTGSYPEHQYGDFHQIAYTVYKPWRFNLKFTQFRLNKGMVEISDGIVPDWSACPSDIVNCSNSRLFYSTDKNKGISHTGNLALGAEYPTRYIEHKVSSANLTHDAFFIILTNLFAGGNLSDHDGDYTMNVRNTHGATAFKYRKPFGWVLYSPSSSISLYKNDKDAYKVFPSQEDDTYNNVAHGLAGTYEIKRKIEGTIVQNIFGFKVTLLKVSREKHVKDITIYGGEVTWQ